MQFQKYIDDIDKRYKTKTAREHTYRPALQKLLEDTIPGILASNDPARIECGAPDFILSRRKIDVGYIEAKDIDDDLDKTEKSDQLKRYRESLENLILTDYLEFRFFLHGEKVEKIRIGEVKGSRVKPQPENFDRLKTLLIDFAAFQGQTIKSAQKLAEMMAHKARLMRDVFFKAVQDKSTTSTLHEQLKAFIKILVHDMDEAQFADVYAQTITYGLFTARLHDTTLDDFSRTEAMILIPKSNPFLRQLFHYVAGPDLDHRVIWIVDALCEVYRATDLHAIMADFGTATGQNDPILHFYETFLAEYNPKLRKRRGVFYTPEPVVNFIVRAIDDVLKFHFGLKEGLAEKSKVKIQIETQDTDKQTKTMYKIIDKEVHKVQLLDVATGTGTFLAEVVRQVYARFKGQEGLWSSYVENDLLHRLHGFELLMASYAMCHMKLDLLLQETGYKPSDPNHPPRVSVYLTNSLEEYHPKMETMFARWLAREANEASRIKKDMPIMIALGNPPYSGESANKSDWILDFMEDYKREPSGGKLKEKNSKWLNDDYVKFIRLGEHYIEKNGEGILAYITNHGYLDNPTFRGMRWHLLNTFDDIFIIDLHGNAKKREVTPDHKPDKNVFDIQQGVAIIVAIKKKPRIKPLATVYHADLWGERAIKYDFLRNNTLKSIEFEKLNPNANHYFFTQVDNDLMEKYHKFISVKELFPLNNTGIVTKRDKLTIHNSPENVWEAVQFFVSNPEDVVRQYFSLPKDVRDWKFEWAKKDLLESGPRKANIKPITYRPFDTRFFYYTGKSRGFVGWPVERVTKHFLVDDNIGLVTARSNKTGRPDHFFCSKYMIETKAGESSTQSCIMPLYLYDFSGVEKRTTNLNSKIYDTIRKIIPDVTPESLFDYIYAVLHSPVYRQRYAEFLKSDFPRIPYPEDKETFHALAAHGAALRQLHLMECPVLDKPITTYPVDGNHEVKKPRFDNGKVWINETQYFGNVPEVAWEFYIGGYQPAQKWLKDRRGRNLTFEDIKHWQRIIVALVETDRIMKEIDKIDFLPK